MNKEQEEAMEYSYSAELASSRICWAGIDEMHRNQNWNDWEAKSLESLPVRSREDD